MKWYPRACPTCSGDLHEDLQDHGWLTCMMCARSFQAKELLAFRPVAAREMFAEAPVELPRAA
jgi:hypothetical protein